MRKLIYKKRKSLSFTLVELLLYIGLSATMLLLTFIFLSSLLEARVKGQVMAEVEQQGVQVMELMTQISRNASKINLPIQGSSGAVLNITVPDLSKNPIVFDVNQNALRITEGMIAPTYLTNSRVIVSNLIFQNVSRSNLPGVVRIQFTISHLNPQNKNEYQYSKTFYNSFNLRPQSNP